MTAEEVLTTEIPAEELLGLLAASGAAPNVAQGLEPDAFAVAAANSDGNVPHPLVDLLRGSLSQGGSDWHRAVLRNLESGLVQARLDADAHDWCIDMLNQACRQNDFSTAASQIGEVRALGTLCRADFTVEPIPTGRKPTPDFQVHLGDLSFFVEVHCKQGNPDGLVKRDERVSVYYPAGVPAKGESIAENVASKIAKTKPKAKQAVPEQPTILWLDLQSRAWWGASEEHTEPAAMMLGLFFSGGLWHAFYGAEGAPMFEYHRAYKMSHPGLFEQSPNWAAAIISLATGTVLFENRSAPYPLSNPIREQLCRLPGFSLSDSRIDLPNGSLSARIDLDIALLSAIERTIDW